MAKPGQAGAARAKRGKRGLLLTRVSVHARARHRTMRLFLSPTLCFLRFSRRLSLGNPLRHRFGSWFNEKNYPSTASPSLRTLPRVHHEHGLSNLKICSESESTVSGGTGTPPKVSPPSHRGRGIPRLFFRVERRQRRPHQLRWPATLRDAQIALPAGRAVPRLLLVPANYS